MARLVCDVMWLNAATDDLSFCSRVAFSQFSARLCVDDEKLVGKLVVIVVPVMVDPVVDPIVVFPAVAIPVLVFADSALLDPPCLRGCADAVCDDLMF